MKLNTTQKIGLITILLLLWLLIPVLIINQSAKKQYRALEEEHEYVLDSLKKQLAFFQSNMAMTDTSAEQLLNFATQVFPAIQSAAATYSAGITTQSTTETEIIQKHAGFRTEVLANSPNNLGLLQEFNDELTDLFVMALELEETVALYKLSELKAAELNPFLANAIMSKSAEDRAFAQREIRDLEGRVIALSQANQALGFDKLSLEQEIEMLQARDNHSTDEICDHTECHEGLLNIRNYAKIYQDFHRDVTQILEDEDERRAKRRLRKLYEEVEKATRRIIEASGV